MKFDLSTPFSLASFALVSAGQKAKVEPPASEIRERFLALGLHIFGQEIMANGVTIDFVNDLHVISSQTDDLKLGFMYGAVPEEDCFFTNFLGVSNTRPVRSLVGLGVAIQEILNIVRSFGSRTDPL